MQIDRETLEQVEAAFREGFKMAASLTPHLHKTTSRENEAWWASRSRAALARLRKAMGAKDG